MLLVVLLPACLKVTVAPLSCVDDKTLSERSGRETTKTRKTPNMTTSFKSLGSAESALRANHHVIVVKLPIKAGSEDFFLALMAPVVEASQLEPGVLIYQLHRGTEDASEFVTYGLFTDQNAFEQHLNSAHVSTWLAGSSAWLAAPMVVSHYALHDAA